MRSARAWSQARPMTIRRAHRRTDLPSLIQIKL